MTAVEHRTPGAPGNALPEQALVLRDKKWIQTFVSLIANGVPIAKAAKLNRLTPKTVEHWLAKGREDDAVEEYANFAIEVDQARAYVETRNLTNIQRAADNGDWRAADRMLVIIDKDTYGQPERGTGGLGLGNGDTKLEITLSFPTGMERDEDAIDADSSVREPPVLEA